MGGYLTFSDKPNNRNGDQERGLLPHRIAPVAVAITAVAAVLIVAVAAALPYRSDYCVQVVSDSSTMYRSTALRVTR
ncbi:hypothetical protein NEUTE2DRAFT_55403 [Neurospora tetrasperma FGSC 2509]|nr:hypothetical protein NEUTE2DRAFT_55403 [Neurospora tetrasperma FGSC 2509]